MKIALLQQALDALKDIDRDDNDRDFLSAAQCYMVDAAIAALQAFIDALDVPEVGFGNMPEPNPLSEIALRADIRSYLAAAADGSMSRNNAQNLAAELLEQMDKAMPAARETPHQDLYAAAVRADNGGQP